MSDGASSGHGFEGMGRPGPLVANPMPNVLGGDSSSNDEEVVGHGVSALLKDAEAEDASHRCPATMEVEDASEDEAKSQPPTEFRSTTFQQLRPSAAVIGAEVGVYELRISTLPPYFCYFEQPVFALCVLSYLFGTSRIGGQRPGELGKASCWREHCPGWARSASTPAGRWHDAPTSCSRIGVWPM